MLKKSTLSGSLRFYTAFAKCLQQIYKSVDKRCQLLFRVVKIFVKPYYSLTILYFIVLLPVYHWMWSLFVCLLLLFVPSGFALFHFFCLFVVGLFVLIFQWCFGHFYYNKDAFYPSQIMNKKTRTILLRACLVFASFKWSTLIFTAARKKLFHANRNCPVFVLSTTSKEALNLVFL